MIVTCPNCYSKFKVGLAVFGRDGRNVKCSACKETWWQEPTLEDVTEEILSEIPQDVFESEEIEIMEAAEAEITEEEFIERNRERVEEFETDQGRRFAYYVAAVVFVVILIYLLLISSPMLKAHPSTQSFYKLFGISIELPDTHSIMFEGVKAERDGTSVTASGRIVNLSQKEWVLPMIEVVVFRPVVDAEGGANEEIIASWVEEPPESTVDAEKEVLFSYSRYISFGEKMQISDVSGDAKVHGDTSAQGLAEVSDDKDMYMVRVHFVVKPNLGIDDESEGKEDSSEVKGEERGGVGQAE
jgi:predicted Zn finger-like uncharacterized protein